MLQAISWSNYLEGAAVLSALYYAGIAAAFYREEIKAFIISKNQPSTKQARKTDHGSTDYTAAFENLESIVHEIDSILAHRPRKISCSRS